jgi:hypothetical protein
MPAETAVARQWLSSCRVTATTEELLEEVFSVQSVPRLFNEGQLPLQERVCSQSVSQSVQNYSCYK